MSKYIPPHLRGDSHPPGVTTAPHQAAYRGKGVSMPPPPGDADLAHRLDHVEQVHAGRIGIPGGVGAKTFPVAL